MANGTTYRDNGHFAGDTTVFIDPDGTVILRNRMNKPWQDFLQAAGSAYGAYSVASVSKATIAADKAVDLGAQRAAVSSQRIDASVEKLGIETAADIEKLRIVTP